MPLVVTRVALALLWSSALMNCGQSDTTPPVDKPRVCEPGTGFTCVTRGCNGHQHCLDDGSALTRCMCDSESERAGKGGSSGAAAGSGGAAAKDAGSDALDGERCDDGEDNDGDGDVDCADDDCAAMRCSAAAPSGWLGPVVLHAGAEAAECPPAFADTAFSGGDEPDAPAARCSTCSCEGSSSCASFIDFGTSDGEQCAGTSCTTSLNQACAEISPPCLADLSTAYLKTKLPSGSGCKPSEQHADKPAAGWKTQALACRTPAVHRGGCNSDQLCLPAAGGGDAFQAGYCVWREGEHDCPKNSFTQRRVYRRELKDTRACSACSCGGAACAYRWRIFNADDSSCATPLLELSNADECVQVNPSEGKLRVGAMISGGGACTPAGGESSGSVSAEKPVTVCCSE